MKLKLKIIAVFLLAITMSMTLLSCSSKEYRYDIKRFVGEYEVEPDFYYFDLSLYDYSTNKTIMKEELLTELTEYGYYQISFDNHDEIVFFERKFDANLVAAINSTISMLGKKIRLKKDKIIFKDSNESINITEYFYTTNYIECIEIHTPEKEDGSSTFARAYYDDYTGKELKKIIITSYANVKGTDEIIYKYYIHIKFNF